MSTQKLPVVAAIPNYNMAESLRSLLPALLKQGYDHIYILDDDSSDYSMDVVALFEGGKVTFVKSSRNGGAGAARNMILDVVNDLAIVHFLDADIQLDTDNIAAIAQKLFDDSENIGFIGGLVRTADGRQSYWNYGERQSAAATVSSWGQSFLESMSAHHPAIEDFIRHYNLFPGLASRPNPTIPPVRTTTFWVSEANFLIRSDIFRKLGGFDPSIREHDIQTLAMSAQRNGYVNYFDPAIGVTHLGVNVRKYFRPWAIFRTEAYLIKKYGVREWLFSSAQHNTEA